MRRSAGLLLVLLLPGLAAAEAPSPREGARQAPRKISFEVERLASPDGRDWLAMRSENEAVYPYGIEEVAGLLRDFEAGSEIFSRVGEVRLLADDGKVAEYVQTSVVRVLGLTFVSKLTFRNETEWEGRERVIFRFRAIETDGSAYSSEGSWELESLGEGSTLVRYRAETWVEPRFPGQEGIMRAFGAADFQRVMRELGRALERAPERSPAGPQSRGPERSSARRAARRVAASS